MSYSRVIPRDLFNEANLLKCLGKLYLESERYDGSVLVEFNFDEGGDWAIQQNPADGSITAGNVTVRVGEKAVRIYRPLNARTDWPLYAEYEGRTESVFTRDGKMTPEFLSITGAKDAQT